MHGYELQTPFLLCLISLIRLAAFLSILSLNSLVFEAESWVFAVAECENWKSVSDLGKNLELRIGLL